ncbi:MAG TPA: hypothetical protein VN938_14445 [Xanthobacteraceae bacterium]|nr:hypothetical protein [Xanthobacteraceae bacterium]
MLNRREQIPAGGSLREQRERRRVHRAAEATRGDGATAMAVALAHIGAAFDQAAVIHGFKSRVERIIALPPDHPAVQARYSVRAAMLAGCDLDAAIMQVERWWRNERKAFQIASAFGCGTRLSLDVLSELRLILRLMRRKQMHAEFERMRAAAAHDRVLSPAAE